MKNLELGVLGGYGINKMVGDDDVIPSSSSKSYKLGAELSYYIPLPRSLYLSIGGGYNYFDRESSTSFSTDKVYSMHLSVRPGLHYIVNNKLGVFFKFGPEFSKFKAGENNWTDFKMNAYSSSTGVSFYF